MQAKILLAMSIAVRTAWRMTVIATGAGQGSCRGRDGATSAREGRPVVRGGAALMSDVRRDSPIKASNEIAQRNAECIAPGSEFYNVKSAFSPLTLADE